MATVGEAPTEAPVEPFISPVKDLRATLVSTRNLEINLFWQRANYFLVLNSGLVLGVFNITQLKFKLVFAVLGIFASALWFWVCLGGKYWQTRWEQRLFDFENKFIPGLDFFGAPPTRLQSDVRRGFNLHPDQGVLKRLIYKAALRFKPSVSFSMTLLAGLFFIGWIVVTAMFAAGYEL